VYKCCWGLCWKVTKVLYWLNKPFLSNSNLSRYLLNDPRTWKHLFSNCWHAYCRCVVTCSVAGVSRPCFWGNILPPPLGREMEDICSKYWYPPARLHCVITQKTTRSFLFGLFYDSRYLYRSVSTSPSKHHSRALLTLTVYNRFLM
jgi:hypothetical protein